MSPTAAYLSPRNAGLLAVAGGTVMGASYAAAPRVAVLACAFALVVLLCALPRAVLPGLALAAYALVPLSFLPVPETAETLSPSVLVLVVWAVRLLRDTRTVGRAPTRGLAVALVLGTPLLLSLAAALPSAVSLGWTGAFAVNVLLPVLLLPYETPEARRRLVRTWVVCAGVVGGYAALEAVVRWNPLAAVGRLLGAETVQQDWAFYRATSTLSHPLEAGAFLAVSLPLCLGLALHTRTRTSWAAAAAVAVGIVATGSRGPTAAALAGSAFVLWLFTRRVPGAQWERRRRRRLLALSLPVLPLTLGCALLVRSGSAEGADSSDYRLRALREAWAQVQREPLLGVGPGASGVAKAEGGGPFASLSYENGWVEAAVSVGLPFAALLLGAFLLALVLTARAGAVGISGAVLASIPVIGASNVLEGSREGLVRWGLLLGLALCTSGRGGVEGEGAADPQRQRRATTSS